VKRTQPLPTKEAVVPNFSVYVVELKESVCRKTACPSRDSGKPHVYVGETQQTPEERFEEHLAGGFTSAHSVFEHGIRLKPRLYRNWGPYRTRQESLAGEARLAERLRKRSFCVRGGH
jgi:hypothetical protein